MFCDNGTCLWHTASLVTVLRRAFKICVCAFICICEHYRSTPFLNCKCKYTVCACVCVWMARSPFQENSKGGHSFGGLHQCCAATSSPLCSPWENNSLSEPPPSPTPFFTSHLTPPPPEHCFLFPRKRFQIYFSTNHVTASPSFLKYLFFTLSPVWLTSYLLICFLLHILSCLTSFKFIKLIIFRDKMQNEMIALREEISLQNPFFLDYSKDPVRPVWQQEVTAAGWESLLLVSDVRRPAEPTKHYAAAAAVLFCYIIVVTVVCLPPYGACFHIMMQIHSTKAQWWILNNFMQICNWPETKYWMKLIKTSIKTNKPEMEQTDECSSQVVADVLQLRCLTGNTVGQQ